MVTQECHAIKVPHWMQWVSL